MTQPTLAPSDLLEIAKEVIRLNRNNLENLSLTGSLMLWHNVIETRREPTDIDFVCNWICEKGEGFPLVPSGFRLYNRDGGGSCVHATTFINDEAGVKIDFMVSEHEESFTEDGIQCASITGLVQAKLNFAMNDLNEESRRKHLEDVAYLFNHNNLGITNLY